jgi:hypothetical protein
MPDPKYSRASAAQKPSPTKLNTVDIWQIMGDRCCHCRMSRQILELRSIPLRLDECGGILLPICEDCHISALALREVTDGIEALPMHAGLAAPDA